ncbi:MAG: alpha/beta hydrolase-fold protein [Candidatus Wallbacteria bacterium]|nr:alpha/beta hydrolase-fold protein [Candidatus Wallbacteria bacterium]
MIPVHSFFHDFRKKIEESTGFEKERFANIFWQKIYGMRCPLVTAEGAIFLVRNQFETIHLIGDHNNWQIGTHQLQRISGTDIAYCEMELPPTAAIEYKFCTGSSSCIDSLNQFRTKGIHGENSLLKMPYYAENEAIRFQDTPSGKLLDFTVDSHVFGTAQTVYAYLPLSFDPLKNYTFIAFIDGDNYLHHGGIVTILDNLVHHGKIEPCIAFFFNSYESFHMHSGVEQGFSRFFRDEFLQFVKNKFPLRNNGGNLVVGNSESGLSALRIFSGTEDMNVLLQSVPLHAIPAELLDSIRKKGSTGQQLFVQCGTYETAIRGLNLIESNRTLCSDLKDQVNFRMHSAFFAEGHSWHNWSNHFIDAVIRMNGF